MPSPKRSAVALIALAIVAALPARPSVLAAEPAPASVDPDRPARTTSGKVLPSADADLPPALGPNPAKPPWKPRS